MKLEDYDLIFSDVDGVLMKDGDPIEGNLSVIRRLIRAGKRVILITNNSGFSRVLLSRQLSAMGVEIPPTDIVTSGVAAAVYLKDRLKVRDAFVVGEEGLVEELRARGIRVLSQEEVKESTPESVVVGLDRFCTYEKLSLAMHSIMMGAKFVVTNMDRLWPSKKGFKLGAGALASSIIFSLRREPDFVAGKPNPWIIEAARSSLGIDGEGKMIMIGDQLEIDVRMGKELGIDTLLVLTGVSKQEDIKGSSIKPDVVVQDLTHLYDEA
ncbi:haloacid dehalogenase [Sulfodiicoccus acidiphilus]|uniref:Haloacid dehalogenase n=1 Tax=Sulfodiicoccus acidiphilus TaxID=1670455 RepID=A0A348B2L6_9CREN|nr:HAD-IIA family hydrolase [Sulfodiicoccus acidiphilus]BBD72418.1 haloacid dehalogenase [Sulfodiicoccus acidiphilus]GGT97274.1 haloacid dehalogenase [Sulfodiicoccus acidiphilus]